MQLYIGTKKLRNPQNPPASTTRVQPGPRVWGSSGYRCCGSPSGLPLTRHFTTDNLGFVFDVRMRTKPHVLDGSAFTSGTPFSGTNSGRCFAVVSRFRPSHFCIFVSRSRSTKRTRMPPTHPNSVSNIANEEQPSECSTPRPEISSISSPPRIFFELRGVSFDPR